MSAEDAPPEAAQSRPLTPAEVRALILTADYSAAGEISRQAARFSHHRAFDAHDLIQSALCKALTTRSCPADQPIEASLIGIMRSLASTSARSAKRRKAHIDYVPPEEIALMGNRYTVAAADEIQEIERVRALCADVLERLSADPDLAALIEAIGFDLRGQALADHLGMTRRELASLRRSLKRKIQRIWPDVEPMLVDGVVADSPWDG